MPTPDLNSLSVTELLALRDAIDNQLLVHRSELRAQLAQIETVNGKGGPAPGAKVAPKYRHPTTGETWSGRGGVAGWLAREIESGRAREDFLIDTAADRASAKSRGTSK